jgi:hypothetical protein
MKRRIPSPGVQMLLGSIFVPEKYNLSVFGSDDPDKERLICHLKIAMPNRFCTISVVLGKSSKMKKIALDSKFFLSVVEILLA